MTDYSVDHPPFLGLLPSMSVAKFLTHGIQAGLEEPPQVMLRKAATPMPREERRWATGPIRVLLDEAMARFTDHREHADGWLAPRLHATLRMTRAEAADPRLWNFLAMIIAPDYVVWRHKGRKDAIAARFSGPHYTQTFARLWWAAELFRDGDDYRPVELACRYQDVLNTTMHLDVIDHRPTALAILRVLALELANGMVRPSDQINALSAAVNLAGSTIVFDVLAPDTGVDPDAIEEWIAESEDTPPVPWDRLPEGPLDGRVSASTLAALVPWFTELLREAPLRSRERRPAFEE